MTSALCALFCANVFFFLPLPPLSFFMPEDDAETNDKITEARPKNLALPPLKIKFQK